MIKTLGVGGYGKVKLCHWEVNNTSYALKMMSKKHILAKHQTQHVEQERHLLGMCQHPFLMQLRYAFQTADKLYMCLEGCWRVVGRMCCVLFAQAYFGKSPLARRRGAAGGNTSEPRLPLSHRRFGKSRASGPRIAANPHPETTSTAAAGSSSTG